MLRQSLKALSAQCESESAVNIYVSDNSSNFQNSRKVELLCNQFDVGFRASENVSVAQHYHDIFMSLKFAYLTILHDDDLVMPGFVCSVFSEIQQDDSFSVFGFNALMFKELQYANSSYSTIHCSTSPTLNCKDNLILRSPSDVLFRWISPFCNGIVPLSGLTFNLSLYQESFFAFYARGGLFFDTLLVLLFSESAPVKWIAQSTLVMVKVHDLRLTEEADFFDSASFANAVLSRYVRDWKIPLLMNYFVSARKISQSYASNFISYLSIYSRYFVSLLLIFVVWPVGFVRLLFKKLANLLLLF